MPNSSENTPKVRYLQIEENAVGQRIDNFLFTRLKGVPKSWVYRVMRRGEVRVNKRRIKPTYRLCLGDAIRIPPLRTATSQYIAPNQVVKDTLAEAILYEDAALLVINKPSGFAVHGGSGISHGVIEILRATRPQAAYLELAHRLDRDTSGCLLIAKKRSVLQQLHGIASKTIKLVVGVRNVRSFSGWFYFRSHWWTFEV